MIGIDCNFGYAEEVGLAQFGKSYTYIDVWNAIDYSCKHLPNFFAEGFWQSEFYGNAFWTHGPKPKNFNQISQRVTEIVCRQKGYGHPESPFKLIGPKQVGKGGLAGMRMLCDLKKKFGNKICVWPFEKNFDEAKIIITEIYPRLFIKNSGFGQSKIRDTKELNNALSYFKSAGIEESLKFTDHISDAIVSSAALRSMVGLGPILQESILKPKEMTVSAALREGWILGV